jgi:CBS domain-containing protein
MMPRADAYLDAGLRHRRKVEDVMTTAVVTVDRLTPYKEIAFLLAEHKVSSLPVLANGWQVIGTVSETSLLAARDGAARQGRAAARHGCVPRPRPATFTAGELMAAPPVTIRPDATISAATRVMTTHQVTSLPVTGAEHELIGIVSRRDLLSVFLRPDADIVRQVRYVIDQMPFGNPSDITVTVRHGIVSLAGVVTPRPGQHEDLVPATLRLIWDIDGVVNVVNELGEAKGAKPAAV